MTALRILHLLAMAVWVGGLITLGALIAALRRHGVDREVLRVIARRFGALSWPAMGILLVTGFAQVPGRGWDGPLVAKTAVVAVIVGLAAWHQVAAKNQSPSLRGALQGTILVLSIAAVGISVAL